MRDVEVQGYSSPHPTHCIKHSHPLLAAIHSGAHTARGLQVKQVADRYCIFLEAVMRCVFIEAGPQLGSLFNMQNDLLIIGRDGEG